MDELDQRLRARLERLADAVPVAPEPVATVALRPERASIGRFGIAGAALVVVLTIAVTGVVVGLGGRTVSTSASATPAVTPTPPASASVSPPRFTVQRYADGIPASWAGEAVHRGAEARQFAAQQTDPTPFLVAGWLTISRGLRSCPAMLPNANPWLPNCGEWSFSDVAGAGDLAWTANITFRMVAGGLESLSSGPVIVAVNVHDPRAAECGVSVTDCVRMMVATTVAWSGDAATAGAPIDPTAALNAMRSVDTETSLAPPDGSGFPLQGCGGWLASAQIYTAPSSADRIPSVADIFIEPSPDAMLRALPMVEGADATWYKESKICETTGSGGASQWRWLRVANVGVIVHLGVDGNDSDHAFVSALGTALELAAAGTSPAPSSAVAPCGAAALRISVGRSGAATGTAGVVLRFQNTGVATCSLAGAPAVEGVTQEGPTTAATIADQIFGMPASDGSKLVVLDPAATAYAALVGTDNPSGDSPSCPPPYSNVRITLSGGQQLTLLGIELPACSGLLVSPFSSVEQAP